MADLSHPPVEFAEGMTMDYDTDPESLDTVEDLRLLAASLLSELESWRSLYNTQERNAALQLHATSQRCFDLVELALKA